MSAFTLLVVVPLGITSSAAVLKIYAINAGIKKCKSFIIKKKKSHDETVLIVKAKLDTIEVLLSKAIIDLCISHGKFVLVNNVSRKYNNIIEQKKKEKFPKLLWKDYKYG